MEITVLYTFRWDGESAFCWKTIDFREKLQSEGFTGVQAFWKSSFWEILIVCTLFFRFMDEMQ